MMIESIHAVREKLRAVRGQQKIALVGTMGNLHQGHLHLVKLAKQHADYIVVSIFVNPMQFGPKEDFASYPRTLEGDLEKLSSLDVDLVFAPKMQDIYPAQLDVHTKVTVPNISDEFCGLFRPGFFTGVATVVCKLFNIIQPNIVIFGEKDFQQLHIIRQLVQDLCFPIQIISSPIIREEDGLAMSSRNQYLLPQERKIAGQIYQTLLNTGQKLMEGEVDFNNLTSQAKNILASHFKVDYFSICKREDLKEACKDDKDLIILVAAWLGRARLIDNLCVDLC